MVALSTHRHAATVVQVQPASCLLCYSRASHQKGYDTSHEGRLPTLIRLLKRSPAGNIGLASCEKGHLPLDAILSHMWTDGQDVTYSELMGGASEHKTGYDKISLCIEQATHDGIGYS